MFYTESYKDTDGTFTYQLSCDDDSVQALLAGIPVQNKGLAAGYLSDLGYSTDDMGVTAVLYQYADDAVDVAYDNVQEKVKILAKRYGLVFELGLESDESGKLLEIAVPELMREVEAPQPELFLKELLELDLIAGAWLVKLSVTEDTLPETGIVEGDSHA